MEETYTFKPHERSLLELLRHEIETGRVSEFPMTKIVTNVTVDLKPDGKWVAYLRHPVTLLIACSGYGDTEDEALRELDMNVRSVYSRIGTRPLGHHDKVTVLPALEFYIKESSKYDRNGNDNVGSGGRGSNSRSDQEPATI